MPAWEDNDPVKYISFKMKLRIAARDLHFTLRPIMIILHFVIGRVTRRRRTVEHIDPSVCEVEFRLLCIMSAISLAISGTVIFLLV
jgi:hypothetical protein